MMHLHDRLQICLLAVVSRYPDAFVRINEDVLGFQSLGTGLWRPLDLIDLLQNTSPEMLQMMVSLNIDEQRSAIYALDYSEVIPALTIHCRGKVPT
jgi:hypothetical protein